MMKATQATLSPGALVPRTGSRTLTGAPKLLSQSAHVPRARHAVDKHETDASAKLQHRFNGQSIVNGFSLLCTHTHGTGTVSKICLRRRGRNIKRFRDFTGPCRGREQIAEIRSGPASPAASTYPSLSTLARCCCRFSLRTLHACLPKAVSSCLQLFSNAAARKCKPPS